MILWVLYNEHRQIYREQRQFIWWNKEVVGNLWTSNTRIKTGLYLNEDRDTLINPGFISTIDSLIQTYFGRLLGVRYCSMGCGFSSKHTVPCPHEAGILVARTDLSIICPFYSIWICVCIISLSSYRNYKEKFSGVWKRRWWRHFRVGLKKASLGGEWGGIWGEICSRHKNRKPNARFAMLSHVQLQCPL